MNQSSSLVLRIHHWKRQSYFHSILRNNNNNNINHPFTTTLHSHNTITSNNMKIRRTVATTATVATVVSLSSSTFHPVHSWVGSSSSSLRNSVHHHPQSNVHKCGGSIVHPLHENQHQQQTHPFLMTTTTTMNRRWLSSYTRGGAGGTSYKAMSTAVADEEEVSSASSSSTSAGSTTSSTTTTSVGSTSHDPIGTTIAEGVVVARYPGGFTAVRVSEEFQADLKEKMMTLSSDGLSIPNTPTTSGGTKKSNVLSVKVEVGDYQGKQVVFDDIQSKKNGILRTGVVVAHRPPLVYVYSAPSDDDVEDGDDLNNHNDNGRVKITDTSISITIPRGKKNLGVLDCFGRVLLPTPEDAMKGTDGKDSKVLADEDKSYARSIFSAIPQVKDIALINNPMLTGITMIDTLASIGRGQNMLLIGSDREEMRSICMDFMSTQINQSNQIPTRQKTKCIYALTTTDDNEDYQTIYERFQQCGIADDVQIVAPRRRQLNKDQQPLTGGGKNFVDPKTAAHAAEAVVIAATACAIGEAYACSDDDQHALIIIDTLDYHKKLWDTTTRVMVDVFGVDAVVKSDRSGGASSEMRGFYSALIQRAAQYKPMKRDKNSDGDFLSQGGSITLLFLVSIPPEIQEGDDDDDTSTNQIYTVDDFMDAPLKTQERVRLLVEKKIPLSASTLRKINIPVPSESDGQNRFILQHVDDLMSMSDGQIWFDDSLSSKSINGQQQQPPLDPQRSVTRIGIGADTPSRADAPALRRIVEGLRLELAQATDTLNGMMTNNVVTSQNRRQLALKLALHQPITGTTPEQKQQSRNRRRTLAESCIVLLAAQKGYLDEAVQKGAIAGTDAGDTVILYLLEQIQLSTVAQPILHTINTTYDMTDEEQMILTNVIADIVQSLP